MELRQLFGKQHCNKEQLAKQEIEHSIGAVIVGIDAELTYTKVAYALACLNRKKDPSSASASDPTAAAAAIDSNYSCLFLSTNQDSTLPTAGHTLPGAGSCVAMLAAASGRVPINIGKPEVGMLNMALEKSDANIHTPDT